MLESQKPTYEGLNQEAADLWRKFLMLYQDQFESYTYNVRCGQGLDPGPSVSEQMRAMWKAVTSKRVDCVAERLDQTWIIEVEPRPGLRTLGQVVGYAHLLPKSVEVRTTVVLAVVSQFLGRDMAEIFRAHNIAYFVFPGHGEPRLPSWFPPAAALPAVNPPS